MAMTFEQYAQAFEGTSNAVDIAAHEATIRRIFALRDEKNAVILGHNYMPPVIYGLSEPWGRGDSLLLAQRAADTAAAIIVLNGVRFMAETAKILSPHKKVLIASKLAGCSLADPIRAAEVRRLKQEYPGIPIVTYINSYADVKAESDYCCTSANALNVIRHVRKTTGRTTIIFLPDTLMGKNLQAELDAASDGIDLIYPGKKNSLDEGRCEVHEKFTVADLQAIRKEHGIPKGHPRRAVLAHWECPPDVLQEADYHGSTSQMMRYVSEHQLEKVYLATECEMAANLQQQLRGTQFVRACMVFCQHMQRITLDGILHALETEDPELHEVTVAEPIRRRALVSIERMLAIGRSDTLSGALVQSSQL